MPNVKKETNNIPIDVNFKNLVAATAYVGCALATLFCLVDDDLTAVCARSCVPLPLQRCPLGSVLTE